MCVRKVEQIKKYGLIKEFLSEIVVIRNCGRENGHFFREKSSFRNLGPREIFPSPQTRRQVSTDGYMYVIVMIAYIQQMSDRP